MPEASAESCSADQQSPVKARAPPAATKAQPGSRVKEAGFQIIASRSRSGCREEATTRSEGGSESCSRSAKR
jgi:hypothetical protein